MKKEYEALSVDVVKFEAQDVITASGGSSIDGSGNGYDSGNRDEYPR